MPTEPLWRAARRVARILTPTGGYRLSLGFPWLAAVENIGDGISLFCL